MTRGVGPICKALPRNINKIVRSGERKIYTVYMFVAMDIPIMPAMEREGMEMVREREYCKMFGAFGSNELNGNRGRLLAFAGGILNYTCTAQH